MYTYIKTLWHDPATARKAWLALVAVVAHVVAIAFVDWTYAPVVIGLATAMGVYAVPNTKTKAVPVRE